MEKGIWIFIPKEHQILPDSLIWTHEVAQTSFKPLAMKCFDYRYEPPGLTLNLQLHVFYSVTLYGGRIKLQLNVTYILVLTVS